MKCKKRKVCSVCGGSFKMTRGCSLEKRCPACRFLDIQKGTAAFRVNDKGTTIFRVKNIRHPDLVLFDESLLIERSQFMKEAEENGGVYIEDCVEREEGRDIIMSFLHKSELSQREVEVIQLRLGFNGDESSGNTTKEMAEMLNLSMERVRQIESSAIRKLKHPKSAFIRVGAYFRERLADRYGY